MKTYSLLIGNDIDNISPNNSWRDLINEIINFCDVKDLVTNFDKPFPMLYEEIFLQSLRKSDKKEIDLKKLISKKVSKIETNQIHERIRELNTNDIMTTNYEFSLEGLIPWKKNELINETRYSIFRHYEINFKRYWHLHGDCKNSNSINLGFEHYIGQLQQMRNYVVTGVNYESKEIPKTPLIKRLKKQEFTGQSWIELFFNTDVHIFGLSLDFIETDLWWLLTYRAREKFYKKRNLVNNSIFYYIPEEFKKDAKGKIDVLKSNGVIVIDNLSGTDKLKYYNQVLDGVEKPTQ